MFGDDRHVFIVDPEAPKRDRPMYLALRSQDGVPVLVQRHLQPAGPVAALVYSKGLYQCRTSCACEATSCQLGSLSISARA